jgi:hypothetical protein
VLKPANHEIFGFSGLRYNQVTECNLSSIITMHFKIAGVRLFLLLALTLALAACSSAPYRADPSVHEAVVHRAVHQKEGLIEVRASVAGDAEAKQMFGIPLQKRDIQAVWVEISNHGATRARFSPYSVDKDYFPPHEVAYMFRKNFSKQGWLDLERELYSVSLRRQILPGETHSGYVFTNKTEGTKAFNLDVFYTDGEAENEHFTFFINVPGFTPDHAKVEFANLYKPEELMDLDKNGLRQYLETFPCCTANQDGSAMGRPVSLFIVAKGEALLQSLLRAGWSETSYERSSNYLNISDYLFERPPDAIFRRGRDKKRDRHELSLWMSPVFVDGKAVWVGQIKNALGRVFEIQDYFLGVKLDPNESEGRNYFMQNMWYSRSLLELAWSDSGKFVGEDEAVLDFNDNAWFSDGLRLVLWLSGDPVSLAVAKSTLWDDPAEARWTER